MTEQEFSELVSGFVEESLREESGEHRFLVRVRSFRESGVMTSNEGFVVRVGEEEFQVTVVRSR